MKNDPPKLAAQSPEIQEEYREQMNRLAYALDRMLNPDADPKDPDSKELGFLLCVFPFGDNVLGKDRFNYISNANGLDVRASLKEIEARLSGRLMPEHQNDPRAGTGNSGGRPKRKRNATTNRRRQ